MKELVAAGTLERARYFLARASASAASEPHGMRYDLEAAIIFARSVTFHLQKELSGRPGFEEWYAATQMNLSKNPAARFLLETRNFILKEGPAPVQRRIVAILNEVAELDEALQVRVKRGSPWYRRSARILFEDTIWPVRELLARVRQAREQRAKRARLRPAEASPSAAIQVVFGTPPVEDQSVFTVVEAHFQELGRIVQDAQERFGSP